MSNLPIKDATDATRKVDVFQRTEGPDTVDVQAVALINPADGNPLRPTATGALPLSADAATETTLAQVRDKLISAPATAALQGTGNSALSSIDGKVATETTLAQVRDKLIAAPATAALQGTGNTTLSSIDGKVATETTLVQVRDAIRAQIDVASTIWTDNSGAYYVRRDLVNEGTGVITVAFTDPAGTTATPGAGLRPLAMADRDVTQALFDATAGGTGYSSGDVLARLLITDVNPSTPTVTAIWVNVNTGSVISAPTGGTFERADEAIGARQVGSWTAAVTSTRLDNLDADLGNVADASATSDTGSFSLIALTKRWLERMTTLLARTPNLGFAAASASSPVVVSNDLSVLSTAVQSAVNTDLLTETVNGWYDARAFHSASLQIIGGAGISAGAVFFEQTNDPTNAAAGRPWLLQEHDVLNSNPQGAAIAIAANTQRMFEGAITGGYIRARISTAFVGGTVRIAAVLSQLPYQATRFNVQQATAGSLNMTATLATNTPTLAAGTNLAGDVAQQYRANATGAASGAHIVSAASANATIVKASAGRVLGWNLANTTAAWKYVKLHNQATLPTAGAGVVRTIAIPPNGSREANIEGGIAFTTGIGLTITNGAADNDTAVVAVNDVVGDLFFA